VSLDSPDLLKAGLAGDLLGGRVARLDQAHESREPEGVEGEVADSGGCLRGVAPVPVVAAEVVAELGDLLARDLDQLEAAVAHQAAVFPQAYREEAEAVLTLVLEVALQPSADLLSVERRLAERGHHRRVAEDLQQSVHVLGDHRAQNEPLRLDHEVMNRSTATATAFARIDS